MAIESFNRYEHKYKLDTKTFNKVLEIMDEHMELDSHCGEHSLYTIANIYYDTKDNSLIRESLSKPAYKEKLRLRSYGVPDMDSKVFLEIKKKYRNFANFVLILPIGYAAIVAKTTTQNTEPAVVKTLLSSSIG